MRARLRFSSVIFLCLAAALRLAAQSISSFNPTFGASTDPSFVMISGSGFSGGPLVVRFNGVASTNAHANTDTQIQTGVPGNAPLGSGPISVQVGAGAQVFSLLDFTVIGPGPYVNSFTPGSGSSSSTVTLNGSHFTGVTNIQFNGRNASSMTLTTDTQISAVPPAGVSTGPITVRSPKGVFTTVTNFFVPPSITGFSPSAGRGGTNVLITGSNFSGTISVSFGGVASPSVTVLSNNALTATVPAACATGPVRLFAPGGSFPTTSNFVVQPTVFGFSPAFGPPTTSVTVTGANFQGVSSVKFNGATATFSLVGTNQLNVAVPAAATSGPISVTTSNGTHISPALFYVPASIASFSPTNSAPGTTVRINGNNFTNASAISFNGAPATSFVVTNNTTIGAVVPTGITTGPISITTPAGTTNSAALFYALPGISTFNPTHGLPGTNVVISGSNFLGATVVNFNGLVASFTVSNNTTIGAVVPSNAQTGPLTVIAPAGTAVTPNSFVLDYNADVSVTLTNSPNAAILGSNLLYSVAVINNGPFAATNVRITNTLPGTVTLKTAVASQGVLVAGANPITGNLGTIPVGSQATVSLTVTPQSLGLITNIVSVASDFLDFSPANNTASLVLSVVPLPILLIQAFPTNSVRVSWSVALSNFNLEFKTSLSSTDAWSNNLVLPAVSGSENVVIETNAGAAKFYRLRK